MDYEDVYPNMTPEEEDVAHKDELILENRELRGLLRKIILAWEAYEPGFNEGPADAIEEAKDLLKGQDPPLGG